MKITEAEILRKKKRKTVQNMQALWDNNVINIPFEFYKYKRERKAEDIFDKIMTENFPKSLTNTTNSRISENIKQDKIKINTKKKTKKKTKKIYTHLSV